MMQDVLVNDRRGWLGDKLKRNIQDADCRWSICTKATSEEMKDVLGILKSE